MNTMNDKKSDLSNELERYCSSDAIPMHMPGHKRNDKLTGATFQHDITEINDFDDLHRPEGLIKELAESAAKLWDANDALISVNGSTGLLTSTVMALSSMGRILIASNCHISVWHGVELSRAKATIINPVIEDGIPFMKWISPEDIKTALTDDPSIKSIIITSPTYEGVVSDVNKIKEIADKYNVLLVVDEAHGAHLGLSNHFRESSRADIVIKSIHKTLSAPTQTAVMLFYGNKAPSRLIRHYKSSTESSSPSYVLMDGICRALRPETIIENVPTWVDSVLKARDALQTLQVLRLYPSDDISKFVILTDKITGYELSDILRERYHIELEAAFPDYVIGMTGIGDNDTTMTAFTDAIIAIDKELIGAKTPFTNNSRRMPALPSNNTQIDGENMWNAVRAHSVPVDITEISSYVGRLSSTYLFAYPPGIPILLPGESVSEASIAKINYAIKAGLHLTTEPFDPAGKLFLVDTSTSDLV